MAAYFQPLIRQYCDNLIVATTNAMARASRQAVGQDLPNVVQSLGQAFDARALPEAKMLEINKRIAGEAQAAMVAGFRSRLPRGGSSQSGSLQGRLGGALASQAMTAGTSARVISFVNFETLNSTARHWYRINYGAAGPNLTADGSHEAQTFTVEIDKHPFVVLRDEMSPAPTTWLPRVFDFEGSRFVVKHGPATERWPGGTGPEAGKGARAAHFTDLGLKVVAEQFGPAYDQFFRQWVFDAKNRARLEKRGINVIADVRLEAYGYEVIVH